MPLPVLPSWGRSLWGAAWAKMRYGWPKRSNTPTVLLWHCGMFRLRQRDMHTAIPMLERGVALCQSTNILLHVPLFTASLGAAYALAGRGVEARPLLDQTLEHVLTGGRFLHHAHVLTELCEA